MLNLNSSILASVVEQALQDASQYPRWLSAIRRAALELERNPYMERNPSGHGLIIGSSSGAAYSANGTCDCEAFQHGNACWHRAAAQLVKRHDERELLASQPAQRPLSERLAAARKATALINELFA